MLGYLPLVMSVCST